MEKKNLVLETNKELKINFYNGIRNDTYFVEN
jgi:hypothetical protein